MGDLSDGSITLGAPLIKAIVGEDYSVSFDASADFLGDIKMHDLKKYYDFNNIGNGHVPCGSEVFVLPLGVFKFHCGGIVLNRNSESLQHQRIGYLHLVHREHPELKNEDLSLSQPIGLDEKNVAEFGKDRKPWKR